MAARADFQPMGSMNITPLIDVMLVLLVMLILTIPMATQKVSVDLPTDDGKVATTKMHRLDIAANGALMLDGAAVDLAALSDRLAPLAEEKQSLLTVNADPTSRYDTFDHVLATIKRSGIKRLGFAGNDRFANF